MEKLIVDLENVVIALPEDKIIIEKSEYDALKKRDTQGRYMSMNELLELLSVSRSLVHRKYVLYKPEIKAQIDIEKNPEGFVKYPNSQGGKYLFLASKTKEYFKSHFREIMIDV